MVRIIFRLDVDDDGYPPFATERMWASETADGLHEVGNIPFYARRIALGDVVSVRKVDDALLFQEVIRPSANSTVRVVFLDTNRRAPFEDGLQTIGCDGE